MMAHHGEPMDIDSDFDNKENSLHHTNVLPFTEKGYEELDVSELNMKLRYSITPASSPMSKSYTANCLDNKSLESGNDAINVTVTENSNLTRSLNSTMTKNDNLVKSLKALPLQVLSTEQFVDNRSPILRSFDSTGTQNNANVTVKVSGPSDIDENLSLPSSSSSALHTPEATTPTKDVPKNDGGSPIMRGLKSVFNIFRSSQSPIPPVDNVNTVKPEILSPAETFDKVEEAKVQAMLASTPISSHRKKEASPSKRNSPLKDSIVFNDDLEKELRWKDETTILFSQERIPIHKLFFQQNQVENKIVNKEEELSNSNLQDNLDSTVEYMDISYNDRTMTDIQIMDNKSNCTIACESDGEFVDCETTFTKNESFVVEDKDKTPVLTEMQDLNMTKEIEINNENMQDLNLTKDLEINNENTSASRLKQIILNTTQDILDATLSITPEDLRPEALERTKNISATEPVNTDVYVVSHIKNENNANETIAITASKDNLDKSLTSQTDQTLGIHSVNVEEKEVDTTNTISSDSVNQLQLDQTSDIISPSLNLGQKDTIMTETILNDSVNQLALDQTTEFARPLVDKEAKGHNNNTSKTDTPDDIIIAESQSLVHSENMSFTKCNEIIIMDKRNEDQDTSQPKLHSQIVDNNVSNSISVVLPDIELHNTGLNILQPLEQNSLCTAENFVADVSCPLEEIKNKPSAYISVHPVEELSLSNLPVDIPLPDEDDLEKEMDVPDTIPEVSSAPNCLPLDLLDIKVKFETTETIHDMPTEGAELQLAENVNYNEFVMSNLTNLEGGDNIQNLSVELHKKYNEKADIKNEMLQLYEESKNVTINEVFGEALHIISNEHENINKYVEETNKTKTVTQATDVTVTGTDECNVTQNQDVVDLNKSIIKLKQLPDIINQAINMPTIDNIDQTVNVPEPAILKQTLPVLEISEKMENDADISERIPNAVLIAEPDPLSDAKISKWNEMDEATNELSSANNKFAISPCTDEINKSTTNTVSKKYSTEYSTVIQGNVSVGQHNAVDAIPIEDIVSEIEYHSLGNGNAIVSECANIETVDEEIVLSENNSPFVSVIAEDKPEMKSVKHIVDHNLDEVLASMGKVDSNPQPASPPIASKGYNFNFDEMDDPFATKTKIRVSPSLDTPSKAVEINVSSKSVEKSTPKREMNNRRKSQPERKKPVASKRKFNSTSSDDSDKIATKPVVVLTAGPIKLESPTHVALDPSNVTIEEDKITSGAIHIDEKTQSVTKEALLSKIQSKLEDHDVATIDVTRDGLQLEDKITSEAIHNDEKTQIVTKEALISKIQSKLEDHVVQTIDVTTSTKAIEALKEVSTVLSKEIKTTSSSEQSTYYSAGTSSSESLPSKNVFNIPEIDDMNFNPFITKSKMRQSPPPRLDIENPFASKSKTRNSLESSPIVSQDDGKVQVQNTTKTISLDDKTEMEPMEKDASDNLSNTTTSSKATDDKNSTMREVNTEDEDTIEGPFLESEDLNTEDKMSDFDGENIDMMQFNDLPVQGTEENLDNGELFIDAEAFEFLLNQNKCNTITDSGKESLFLKFDPLFAKRMSSVTSEGVAASLSKIQKRQSTPTKSARPVQKEVISPIAGPSNLNFTQNIDMNMSEEYNDDLNVTVSKPMMVVPPAVNSVTPRNKSLTPNRSNRRSITFTSPAMAVIDRLLSLSGNSSLHDTTVTQASREQNEADLALTQLRELLAEKEINVYSLRSESKELKDRLTSLESHLKGLEVESQERLKKINDLNNRLAEKTKINKSMAVVVEEYERTIASLISETAQDKKRHAEERIKLINERDEQTAHLASMEVSFSDLHSKYEKSKQVILNCKANEDAYKKSIKEFEENLTKMQNNYELLKQHATSKLNHANQELEKMNRSHEAEVLKLNAMIKRKELHITSLEESLTQKTKANEELTAICDELINKVG